MAETLSNIVAKSGIWTDLYQESGIPVGTLIEVQNVGCVDVYLQTSDTDPATDRDNWNLLPRGVFLRNEGGNGEWVLSLNADGVVNVRVVDCA